MPSKILSSTVGMMTSQHGAPLTNPRETRYCVCVCTRTLVTRSSLSHRLTSAPRTSLTLITPTTRAAHAQISYLFLPPHSRQKKKIKKIKPHPRSSTGGLGLFRHVKAVTWSARKLYRCEYVNILKYVTHHRPTADEVHSVQALGTQHT